MVISRDCRHLDFCALCRSICVCVGPISASVPLSSRFSQHKMCSYFCYSTTCGVPTSWRDSDRHSVTQVSGDRLWGQIGLGDLSRLRRQATTRRRLHKCWLSEESCTEREAGGGRLLRFPQNVGRGLILGLNMVGHERAPPP